MDFQDFIVYRKTMEAREGIFQDFPAEIHKDICTYLTEHGIEQLYSHQVEMFEAVEKKKNVVITTSTASGKTLSFLLPVLQEILKDPLTRAIFVYPTKALAADQYRALLPWLSYFGESRISAGVYDGDTMPAERARIRKSANIILTNPEMLNSAFLPNHSNYGFDFIFSHLKYIVVDELHSYRGAFGAHLANIFRRMERICHYYHSELQFLCSSATIANPLELAENICGKPFVRIEKDGAPSAEKEFCIMQPPVIKGSNDKIYGRRAASAVAAELIPQLTEERRHFIAFGKSRRNVEVVLKEARDKLDAAGFLGKSDSKRIAGYRGGYTPLERKEIERKMTSGELLGLVSTNALELGIDIGSLDTTVLVGYPGSRASFWQQTGRAGRGKNACKNYLILENQPFDQYIAIDPNWLFEAESENAIVDKNNLLIELSHIRAAAAEMPLTMDDLALFPDLGEVIPVLMDAEEVKTLGGKFVWAGPAFPAGDYSLRNMDQTRFKMILTEDGREITEMDESQAYHELHPGAVYMHEGILYEITKLDLINRTAEGQYFNGNYYTVPSGTKETRILQKFDSQDYGRTQIHFGDIHVNEIVSMYKKLQFHNHQNLGYVTLTRPLQKEYETESTWIEIPTDVVDVYRNLLQRKESGELVRNNHFDGLANAIKNAAMMVTMAAQDDIDVIVSNNALIPDSSEHEVVSLFIYDKYVGGLGYSEKIFELIPQILENAIRMVSGCVCPDGCPACVGDYTLDKGIVLWGLKSLLEKYTPPALLKQISEAVKPSIQKEYHFFDLPERWEEFCAAVKKNGDAGAGFLQTVKKVSVEGYLLTLTVQNEFMARWIRESENQKSIRNILEYHVVCPKDMRISIQVEEDIEKIRKKEAKLRRRFSDLTES